MDTISIGKISKGNNSAKNADGASLVNLCMSSVMLYISAKFCEIFSNGIKVKEWIQKITKGNNSAKNVDGVTVLISAPFLVMLYISTKFCDIISNRIKVIERTRFLY